MKVSTKRGWHERQKYASQYRQKACVLDYCASSVKLLTNAQQTTVSFQRRYERLLIEQVGSFSITSDEERLSKLVQSHVTQTHILWENGLIDFDPRYSNFALNGEESVIAFDDDMIGSFQTMSQYDFYRFVKRFWIENWFSLGKFHYLLEQHAKEVLRLDQPINLTAESELTRFLVKLPVNLWLGELPTTLVCQLETAQKDLVAKWRVT